ncbi:ArsR/SmtB family transcription factor [Piscicoccus intestinalis]|uniref:ArsR/SmtB family transcription factor n=1 Tax=Piscicoccus intestinalis TaxID=746033 RepID=UPI001FDF7EB9|nr:metalloregulator ArsR/SmtB family transcription factor [Piscicoccus intestinalis]
MTGPGRPARAASPVAMCAALADDTRWEILCRVGEQALSASELAERVPVTRQAIAHHLAVLAEAGLVESAREGRQLRYRALGWRLTRLAAQLDAVGRGWEHRLDRFRQIAEGRPER